MASVARASGYYNQQRQIDRDREDGLYVLPGRGVSSERAVSPVLMRCFKLAIVFLIGLGVIAVCRVALTSATTSPLMTSQKTTAALSSARSTGDNLEVQQAALANPTRISSTAINELGMVAGSNASYIGITDDVVATDSDGDISVSGSVSAYDPSYSSTDDMVAEQASSTLGE